MRWNPLLLCVMSFVLLANMALADEPATLAISEELQALIKQLDADSFTDRETASAKLTEQGIAAFAALEEAIQSDSLEVSSRAFEIIVKQYQKGPFAVKPAAGEALRKLAEGKSSVARKAKELLAKPPVAEAQPSIELAPGIRFGGRIGMRIAGGVDGGRFRSVSVSRNGDGVSELSLQDGERKLKLKELADKTITGEQTYKKDDKLVTDKIDVKNAAELKEKFPDAFKDYSEHINLINPGGKEFKAMQLKTLKDHLEQLKTQEALPEEARTRFIASMQRQIDRIEEKLRQQEALEKTEADAAKKPVPEVPAGK